MALEAKSDHYHREAPQPMDGDIARIQMDFMFVGAEGTFVDEPRAKSGKDDGNLSTVRKLMSTAWSVRKCRDQDGWRAQHR